MAHVTLSFMTLPVQHSTAMCVGTVMLRHVIMGDVLTAVTARYQQCTLCSEKIHSCFLCNT